VPRRKLFAGPADRRIRKALCVVAHPDDIEFFCAGSVLLMTRRAVTVDFVVATSGDKGSHDPDVEGPRLAALRESEQLAAAKRLGATGVEFLRHSDAELTDNLDLRGELVREIRRSKPDVLFTFDPNQPYRSHPDHRVIGRVALDAAWPCARDRLTYPDTGPAHETAEAWCFAGPEPNLEVDVSEVLDDKIAARLLHRSQTANPAATRARWRRFAGRERFRQVDLR
jgi:LmbE family N-acetylglucosaminyl deacetylase